MNCLLNIKWPWLLVHLLCGLAFLVQLKSVFIDFMEPTVFNTLVEKKDLTEIDFPIVFKICVKPGFNISALEEAGYRTNLGPLGYFLGASAYNLSYHGWAGHSPTAEVQASVADVLTRVSLHTVQTVFKKSYITTRNGSSFDITDSLLLPRVNYPHNCFTLDLSNNSALKENGIESLQLVFHDLNNASVEIRPQGKSLSCNRDIIDHTFSSTGSSIILEKMGMFMKYAVKIKEDRFVEKDSSQGCKIYPNDQFLSYRLAFKFSICNQSMLSISYLNLLEDMLRLL